MSGPLEVFAAALVLDEQNAAPQQVDEATLAVVLFDGGFKRSDAAALDPIDIEEVIPERLGLGILAGFVCPLLGEGEGAILDLVSA